jgi:O-antigen/teichoic acid export membrane protein
MLSKIKKYKSNDLIMHIASSSGLKAITFVLAIMQGIIIARYLLPEGRGEIAIYMVTFNLIFSLLNFGVRQSSSYYLSKENTPLPQVVATQLLVLCFSTILGSVVLIAVYLMQGYSNLFIIGTLLLLFPLRLYINYTNAIALSRRWIHKFNISQLLLIGIEFIGIVLFIVLMEKGVPYYFLALIFAAFITALYIFWWTTRLNDYSLNFNDIISNIQKIVLKGITYALPLFIFGLNYSVDVLILQRYVTVDQVGIYTLGVSLATLLWQVPALMGPIIFSYGVSTNDPSAFSKRLWVNTWKLMLYLLPILAILTFVLPYLIPLVYGKAFSDAYSVFMFLLFGTYAMIAFKMLNSDLASRGNPTAGLYIFAAGALLNIVLNIILIPKLGINGAASASSISYVICAGLFIVRYKQIALEEY